MKEIEYQHELLRNLQNMLDHMFSCNPEQWEIRQGFLPTFQRIDRLLLISEGVDYSVIDNYNIAWRKGGYCRRPTRWVISSPGRFVKAVRKDAQNFLRALEGIEQVSEGKEKNE